MSEQGEQGDYFRQKVWVIINTLQANQLFVHSATIPVKYASEEEKFPQTKPKKTKKGKPSKAKSKMVTKSLPEILTVCILNSIVPNSAGLLVGGHGGGKTSIVKYLGRMFTGMSLGEAEECIIRGHPQLTEEKIIGTLNITKLMKHGEEEVIWRTFSKSFWKIIDEVNRCSPYTQNILLSLLAEGKIKYYDSVMTVSKYCLFATLNPNDVGTFEMSAPFLDRFGISIPISMPKSQDLAIILSSGDEKLGGYDELVQVPQILNEQQLLNIWYDVNAVPCSSEARDFIHAIIREFTLCERVDKGNSDYLKPSTGLCTGCHFFIPDKVPCSNSDSILSVRVAKDLLRYARALTWLLGLKEVTVANVSIVAPYVISHRVNYQERTLNKNPFWGNKYAFTKKLVALVQKRFKSRLPAYDILTQFRAGNGTKEGLSQLDEMARNDLIVRIDILPLAKTLFNDDYIKIVQKIKEATQNKEVSVLSNLRNTLLQEIDFVNRGELISQLNSTLRVLTLHTYNCSLRLWDAIRFTIDGLIPQFTTKLKETTLQRGTYRLRTPELELEINVTGTNPSDIVNFSFYGGDFAIQLRKEIEKHHKHAFKSMDELINQAKLAEDKANEELERNLSQMPSPPSEPRVKKGKDDCEEAKTDGDIFDEDFYSN